MHSAARSRLESNKFNDGIFLAFPEEDRGAGRALAAALECGELGHVEPCGRLRPVRQAFAVSHAGSSATDGGDGEGFMTSNPRTGQDSKPAKPFTRL